jgi:hypothetical protein
MSYRRLLVTEILSHWQELLPSDLDGIHPDGPLLAQLLEARYGFCRDRVEREANSFLADFADRLQRARAA